MHASQFKLDPKLSGDQVLWRYMSLAKFVSLLQRESIWLGRADKLKDKHEGRFPDDMRKYIELAYQNLSADPAPQVSDANDFQDLLTKNTFISSWHENTAEDMTMWEIYCRENEGVAVKTTVERLKRSADLRTLRGNFMRLERVRYENPSDVVDVLPYEQCFFRKRKHFAFERETRLSLDTYSTLAPSRNQPLGHYLRVRLNTLIDEVVVHPDSADWFEDVVSSIGKKFCVQAPVSRGSYGNC